MNLGQIDLNLLVALDVLLRERNVTVAGQRIGLSQPAMSGALGRLRKLFRDELLVRVGRRLELTPLAEGLVDPLRDALKGLETAIDRRRPFDPAIEQRSFTIATADYSPFLLSRPLFARLAVEAPGVSVHFMHHSVDVMESLETGEVDFVIEPAEMKINYPGRLLFADPWVCAVWTGHPDIGQQLTRKQFLSLPHLSFRLTKRRILSCAEQVLADLGVRPRVAVTIENFLLAPFMIEGTRLIVLIQRRLAERVKEVANIRLLTPPFRIPDIHESLYWSPRNTANPPHVWLRSILVDVGAAIARRRVNHLSGQ